MDIRITLSIIFLFFLFFFPAIIFLGGIHVAHLQYTLFVKGFVPTQKKFHAASLFFSLEHAQEKPEETSSERAGRDRGTGGGSRRTGHAPEGMDNGVLHRTNVRDDQRSNSILNIC